MLGFYLNSHINLDVDSHIIFILASISILRISVDILMYFCVCYIHQLAQFSALICSVFSFNTHVCGCRSEVYA